MLTLKLRPAAKAASASIQGAPQAEPPVREIIADEELWRAFQQGEDAAFTMLYGRYADRIYSYLKLLLFGAPSIVDDLFQDVWIQLFRNRERFQVSDQGSVSGWLFRTAHNAAISELRKKNPALSIEELNVDTDLIDGFVTPATQENFDRPSRDKVMQHVIRSVEKLPILLREVFVLSEFNGLTLEHIAETLGITKQNAKVRLFRARRLMRAELARAFDISDMSDTA